MDVLLALGVDGTELLRAVEAYTQLNHELNTRRSRVSDRAPARETLPGCVAETCVDVGAP